MAGWVYVLMDGWWVDGWVGRWMDGWVDVLMDGWMGFSLSMVSTSFQPCLVFIIAQ